MRAVRTSIALAAIATASTLIVITPAGAHGTGGNPQPTPTVLTTALAAPFNLEVDRHRILVADSGLGLIGRIRRDGTVKTVIGDVAGPEGIATKGGYLAHTSTEGGFPITASGVVIHGPHGRVVKADTLKYERMHNPDQIHTYGLADPDACTVDPSNPEVPPPSYTGIVDSHAYSLTAFGRGFVLADAGANALLWIGRGGSIRTLAVLPPQPATISPQVAAQFGLSCSTDVVYNFEAVPTDVEVGPDGFLYVTTLPGGPEDPSLGARGKVYRVNPWTGKARAVATGLLGPTNLAFAKGKLYVTEFFAGRVAKVVRGSVRSFYELPGVVAIESGHHGELYVAALGGGPDQPGTVVRLTTAGKGWRR